MGVIRWLWRSGSLTNKKAPSVCTLGQVTPEVCVGVCVWLLEGGNNGELQVLWHLPEWQTWLEDQEWCCEQEGNEQTLLYEKALMLEIFYQPVVLIEDLHHHEWYCYCLLLSTTNNPSHPLQSTLLKQGSSSSLKLIQPHFHKECFRKSFLLFS